MKRLLLQGFLVFVALIAAGCSSSKAPQAVAPQSATAAVVQPAVASAPATAPLPAVKTPVSSIDYPPITNLSKGMLIVGTVPGRAKVYLNNVYQGVTPLKVEMEPGVHAVSIKLEGYRMVAEKVTVRSGEHTEMDLTLER